MHNSPSVPPEGDDEDSELARFRAEWRAELESRRRARPDEAHPGGSVAGSSSRATLNPSTTHKGTEIPLLIPTIKRKQKERVSASSAAPSVHPALTPDGKVVDRQHSQSLNNALSVYRQAVEHEQQGDLDEALLLYRQAFRMDAHVDRAYHREEMLLSIAIQQSSLTDSASKPLDVVPSHKTGQIEDVSSSLQTMSLKTQSFTSGKAIVTGTLSTLVASFLEHVDALVFKPEDEKQPFAIASLPEEVLLEVIRMLDPASIECFAQVNKKARLLTLDSSIWRDFVLSTYKEPQIPDVETLAAVIERHLYDYRRVYIEQPRVRTDGVYIAICHYIRPGLSENHWVNISHLITYHRYLRFYPNGQVLSLLANEEQSPQNVINILKPTLRLKGLHIGTWKLSGTTVDLSNLIDASGRFPIPDSSDSLPRLPTSSTSDVHHQTRYTYLMSLNLRSKPLGRWNRLDIESYDTLNLETGDITPVALKHERPFWFSKVRSYT